MRQDRLAAIGVDLDGIGCYRQIHGLPPREGPDPVHALAVERLGNLLADHGLRASFFVIGADLDDAGVGTRLRRLAEAGHELASHARRLYSGSVSVKLGGRRRSTIATPIANDTTVEAR